jgi:Fur family ferric uptake transcriptional regulator
VRAAAPHGRLNTDRDPVIEARQEQIAQAHGYEVVGRELVIRVRRITP